MKPLKLSVIFFSALIFSINTFAQTIKVAVAANLQSVINVLGIDFKKKTGITIQPIVGSSGKLVTQISNGAPFDVFLSADMEFPQKLAKDGLSDQPVVYALGSLIICSAQDIDLKNWPQTIVSGQVDKIAIANAAIAPYGRAAEQTLAKLGKADKFKNKLVYGESISQVNAYITTGVATVGFTAQSLVMDPANKTKLYWELIDPKSYSPIEQGMVVIKKSANLKSAHKFFTYMSSASAKTILKKYGYNLP